jgi:hypothetical protein
MMDATARRNRFTGMLLIGAFTMMLLGCVAYIIMGLAR